MNNDVYTVRAALLKDRADEAFAVGTVELTPTGPGEVRVDIKASSLCHSDWNFIVNDYGHPLPALLGHEFAGIVSEVGEGVTSVAPGDHVVACVIPSCGDCDNCLEGKQIWCLHPESSQRGAEEAPRLQTGGQGVWPISGLGGFAESTLVHESQVVAIDKRVPLDRASVLGCAVVTGAGSVIRAAEVRPRDTVVIIGAGGVGLNAVQAAVLVGARKVIVIDVADDKLEMARRFGATHTVNGLSNDAVEMVEQITQGRGADHVFEMTGLGGPLRQGYKMLGLGGTVYIVGMQKPGSEFPINASDFSKSAGVRTVKMGSTNFKIDIPYYAELYLQGRFNLDDLVARTIRLDDINDAYSAMLEGGAIGRTVITFD